MSRRRDIRRRQQQQYRARQRAGIGIASVAYDARVVAFLVDNHWIDERVADDPRQVADGIARMLADAARR